MLVTSMLHLDAHMIKELDYQGAWIVRSLPLESLLNMVFIVFPYICKVYVFHVCTVLIKFCLFIDTKSYSREITLYLET